MSIYLCFSSILNFIIKSINGTVNLFLVYCPHVASPTSNCIALLFPSTSILEALSFMRKAISVFSIDFVSVFIEVETAFCKDIIKNIPDERPAFEILFIYFFKFPFVFIICIVYRKKSYQCINIHLSLFSFLRFYC